MNTDFTPISPETQARNMYSRLEGLANKYSQARENRIAAEFREVAKDAKLLEESLRKL